MLHFLAWEALAASLFFSLATTAVAAPQPGPARTTPTISNTSSAGSATTSLTAISSAVQEIAARADRSVVEIITRGIDAAASAPDIVQNRSNRGSGVIVSSQGHIVTNAHVIGSARRVEVVVPRQDSGGRITAVLLPAKVLGSDRESDIAVLKVDTQMPLPHLEFADSSTLRQGELVLALGSPFGLANSVSLGIVSSAARELRPEDPIAYIQTDASIHPGNSGGPLINGESRIIGINTFILTSTTGGPGFAVPSNTVQGVYDQILRYGRVRRGQIGIVPQTITPRMAKALGLPRDSGVILADVLPGSAAHAAELVPGDIITAVNGKPLDTARQLGAEIYAHAGEMLTLEMVRQGKARQVTVAVLERPQDPDRILSLAASSKNAVPKLGVLAIDLDQRVTPLLPSLRRLSGAVIAGMVSDRSHHDEHLRAGDVVYAVNNTAIRNLEDLKQAVAKLDPGTFAVAHVERQGQLQYLTLEIE